MANGAINTIIKAEAVRKLGKACRMVGKLLVTKFTSPLLEKKEQEAVVELTDACRVFCKKARAILKENARA